jgi:hypothetical protein
MDDEKLRTLQAWKGKACTDFGKPRQTPPISIAKGFRSSSEPGIEPPDPPSAEGCRLVSVQPVFTTPNQGYTDA